MCELREPILTLLRPLLATHEANEITGFLFLWRSDKIRHKSIIFDISPVRVLSVRIGTELYKYKSFTNGTIFVKINSTSFNFWSSRNCRTVPNICTVLFVRAAKAFHSIYNNSATLTITYARSVLLQC
jgi:hypothetical protein